MNSPLIRDIYSMAQAEKTLRGRIGYLLRGFLFLPFLMRDPTLRTGQSREAGGVAPQFDDIYPLF